MQRVYMQTQQHLDKLMDQQMIDSLNQEEFSYFMAYGDDYENEYNAQENDGLEQMLDELLSDLKEPKVNCS